MASKETQIIMDTNIKSDVYARSQHCEKWLLPSSCLSIRLSVLMKQIGSYCTDLHEIRYFRIFFEKSVEKIHLSLKHFKNNGCFRNRRTRTKLSSWIFHTM